MLINKMDAKQVKIALGLNEERIARIIVASTKALNSDDERSRARGARGCM